MSHEYKVGNTVYWHCVQSTSSRTATMKQFGQPAAGRAAGTYIKLFVKTAKYIKPFSQYDGITGPNEEEYLIDFNTKFKVLVVLPYAQAKLLDDWLPKDHDFVALEEEL